MASASSQGLFREERAALALVLAAHIALVAALTLLGRTPKPLPIPPRLTVTIADEVAPEASAEQRVAQAPPDIAPQKGEAAPPPEPAPPEPAPPPPPPPPPRPAPPKPAPAPARPAPAPRPAPRVAPPAPRAAPAPARPVRQPAPAPARPVTAPKNAPRLAAPGDDRPRRRPDAPIGGSRIGADFAKGLPSDASPAPAAAPAAAITGAVKASLAGAISDQLRPKWNAPQGVDAEKLVTVLAWDLNPDGSLAGRPRVVSQSGVTDANRPQAARHAELAIRAVTLAAPFELPAKYYAAWKRIAAFRFDRNLSQ